MQPAKSVSALYAQSQAYKAIWAHSNPNQESFEKYLGLGVNLDTVLFETRAQGIPDVVLKLVELMEWISEDGTHAQISLLASAITDLTGFLGGEALLSDPKPVAPAAVPKPTLDELMRHAQAVPLKQRVAEAREAASKRKPKKTLPEKDTIRAISQIDIPPGWRPIEIDGVFYPNMTVAMRQTGIPYNEVRKLAHAV